MSTSSLREAAAPPATVVELWRYPVKSLLGEHVEEVEVDRRGVRGDRMFAVTDPDGKLGSGKTSARFRLLPGLFELRARIDDGRTLVTLPDGRERRAGDGELDAFLTERYGAEVAVRKESTVSHHDAAPLHLLTTASLRWLERRLPDSAIDRRRFRPNVLLDVAGDEPVEDGWIGRTFALGSTVIRILDRTERCVMTTTVQDELPHDPRVLRAVTELNDQCLGVLAAVEQEGTIRVGDSLGAVE
jgi:uncharacterized protein YcbX